MSPSPAQVEKAIANFQIKIDAKALEISARERLIQTLIGPDAGQLAARDLQTAKLMAARVDLEELRLVQIGYKQALDQMSSRIMKPGGVLSH